MQRRLIWVTLFSVAIVVTALYHTRKVHAQDGCSVASLKGTYAFRRTGTIAPGFGSASGPIAYIGIASYDGDGTRGLIRITKSDNGVIGQWGSTGPGPTGSYTVDSDCTGSEFELGGEPQNNLVVLDGGKRFFMLSVGSGTTVTEEGIRLEEEEKD